MGGRKYGGLLPVRRGFLLAEALAVLLIFSLAAAMAVPSLWAWQEERELDMAAETLASAIREVIVMAKNDTDRLGNVGEEYYFHCIPENGGAAYRTEKGARILRPKGTLPKNIHVSGDLNLTFTKRVFAGGGKDYSLYLMTKDRKFQRRVTVAMYTKRVRVTEE